MQCVQAEDFRGKREAARIRWLAQTVHQLEAYGHKVSSDQDGQEDVQQEDGLTRGW